MTRRADRRHDRDRRLARHASWARSTGDATLYDEIQEVGGAVPGARARRSCPRCGSRRSEHGGWLPPEAFARGRRRARPDARLLPGGRVLLRHVPPRARRASTWSRSARTSRARSSARSRCSRRSRRSSASAPARRPRTARSRCARSSASAAAAGATVVAVDHRYREHVSRRGRPRDRRGAARWLSDRRSSSPAPTSAT